MYAIRSYYEKLYLTNARRRRIYGDFKFNPPMMPFTDDYTLVEVDADYLIV